jgi:hypothetical protein
VKRRSGEEDETPRHQNPSRDWLRQDACEQAETGIVCQRAVRGALPFWTGLPWWGIAAASKRASSLKPLDSHDLTRFEQSVLGQVPPGALIAGSSLSPDGRFGAALTVVPSADDYLIDDVFIRVDDRWEGYTGGDGDAGSRWSPLGTGEAGVLRYSGRAPSGASTVTVRYEGNEYEVPVRHAHFYFVSWNTSFRERPLLLNYR